MKDFSELSEREVLALAIGAEEEDAHIYRDIAENLRERYPASASLFDGMAAEEDTHRRRLLDLYQQRFGSHLPLVRRADVRGFIQRKPIWLDRPLGMDAVRTLAATMEAETQRFYLRAASRTTDVGVRKLLGDLAAEEGHHEAAAARLEQLVLPGAARAGERATERKLFVLQVVQPALAGLMDGSVSTLAPLFAAAFATRDPWDTFLVGLAASIGAGISMGFAEALSDDGSLTGRGRPWIRGGVCGLATAVGGLGHTLPFLIPDFYTATALAVLVVLAELAVISWIRARFMDTPLLQAAFQVVVGGLLVFAAGVLIGSG
ncbi:MAG: rubrerythrin [Acetobacteraceae bacterium]|nr:rubrerythrin [Acetobacteraceae bacterium]